MGYLEVSKKVIVYSSMIGLFMYCICKHTKFVNMIIKVKKYLKNNNQPKKILGNIFIAHVKNNTLI